MSELSSPFAQVPSTVVSSLLGANLVVPTLEICRTSTKLLGCIGTVLLQLPVAQNPTLRLLLGWTRHPLLGIILLPFSSGKARDLVTRLAPTAA